MNKIRNRIASGAIWMIAFRFADRTLGLVSMLVLARLLIPQDFGVVAMAMSVVGLLELLTAFGFDIALIHKKGQDRDQWDTAWTFGVLFGVGTAAVLVSAASPIASFYRTPELADVIRALALGAIIQGFRNIGVVAFRKEMQFDREFRFMLSRKIAGFMVTIPAALILESYWALVIGQVFGRIVETGLSYRVHPYRPRVTLVAARSLMHFSKWLLAANFSGYLRERGADWVLGRMAGAHALGSYNLGAELAAMPSTELLAPVNRALIPAYSKIVNSQGSLATEYISVLSIMALVGVPAVVGLSGIAPLLVPVILGPNWGDVIPVLTVLAFSGLAHIVAGNVYPAYLALGRPDLTLKMNVLAASLFFIGMLIAVPRFGPMGAAWSALLANFTTVPVSVFFAMRLMSVPLGSVVRVIWRPMLAAGVMYLAVNAYSDHVTGGAAAGGEVLPLLGGLLLGAAMYPLAVIALWLGCGRPEGGEAMLLRKALEHFRRIRKPV